MLYTDFLVFERSAMHEKDLNIGYLLDFYGELLPERKHSVMDMYYNEDFSLSEIAAEIGISRQGARDIIKRAEEELIFYEKKLGLAVRFKTVESCASEIIEIASQYPLPDNLSGKISELLNLVKL